MQAALDQAERQQQWRQRSAEKLTAERARRVRELEAAAESVGRAMRAYHTLPESPATVRLRTEFVALKTGRPLPPSLGGPEPDEPQTAQQLRLKDWHTRPPMTKLLFNRTRALPAYLTMLYVIHASGGKPKQRANAATLAGQESWAALCGCWDPVIRKRRARMTRLLDDLHAVDLVRLGARGAQGRYENFHVLQDNESDRDYRLPTLSSEWPKVLDVPGSFFRNGWHLVLTPAEIAMFLAVRHATYTYRRTPYIPDWIDDEAGVGLAQSTRWSSYGISGEAYGVIHELEEFGLLQIHDTMPHRRRGKLREMPTDQRAQAESEGESFTPVPYRLILSEDTLLDRPAMTAVLDSLKDSPLPPRLSDATILADQH